MSKISYIQQMNAFIEFRERDNLSGNATILYLTIFKEFNRTKWQYEWLPISIRDLMYGVGTKSSSTIVLNINILKSLGYIDTKVGNRGRRNSTEFRLLPLYNLPFVPSDTADAATEQPESTLAQTFEDLPDTAGTDLNHADQSQPPSRLGYPAVTNPSHPPARTFHSYVCAANASSSNADFSQNANHAPASSVPSTVPASVPRGVPTSVPTSVPISVPSSVPTSVPSGVPTSVPSGVPTSVPSGVPTSVPKNMPKAGTVTPSQALQDVASQPPKKKKREEKKKSPQASTNLSECIRSQDSYSPTETEFHLCIDTYNVCINRVPHYDEKMRLVRMARQYSAQSVLEVLNQLYAKALKNPSDPAVLAHKNGQPSALGIDLDMCEKILLQKTA